MVNLDYCTTNDWTSGTHSSSSNTAWVDWNIQYSSATTTTTCTDVWHEWNVLITNGSSTATDTTNYWVVWNEKQCIKRRVWIPTEEESQALLRQHRPTPEETAALLKKEEERREQALKEHERQVLIEQRAEALLQENLDEQQRAEYKEKQHFHLYVHGKKYRIDRGGRSGNVKLIDVTGQVEASFCIHHKETMPLGDHMLHQKLLLEADEEQFLKIANRSDRRSRAA